MTGRSRISAYFHEPTNTVTYLVADPATQEAVIIDPVLDYDHRSGKAGVQSIQKILADARDQGLRILWVLETHAHADHLTAAPYVKRETGAPIVIGEHIGVVQSTFRDVFNISDISGTGAEFDRLVKDGESFKLGTLDIEVIHTRGTHQPA